MTTVQPPSSSLTPSLRLWPGVAIVVIQWLVRFALPAVYPDGNARRRARRTPGRPSSSCSGGPFSAERPTWSAGEGSCSSFWGLAATNSLLHESLATAGMGVLFFIYATPVLSLALVAWAVLSRNASSTPRRIAMAVTILLACGVWTLVRTGGITGNNDSDFSWEVEQVPRGAASCAGRSPFSCQGTRCRWSRGGMAGLPRAGTRRHHSRDPDRNRLVHQPTEGTVAARNWSGLVFLRSSGRFHLHPGTAW